MATIIGREQEKKVFQKCYESDKSEFIVVYGRRRVGKTYLIRKVFENKLTFYATGLANSDKKEQLSNFGQSISKYFKCEYKPHDSWKGLFAWFIELLEKKTRKGKKVIFLDEMPWMDTPKSDFLTAVEWFWNSWASARNDIMLIVCGSATTWITKKLLHNHGGLYGRFTQQIYLMPFTLAECEQFYNMYGISFTRYEQIRAYMTFGGIPYYLSMLNPSFSLDQNIDYLCFSEKAPLRTEFSDIYNSLFNRPGKYMQIITLLAEKMSGLTRSQICKATGLPDSGNLTLMLDELETCNLIRSYNGFGKRKKDTIYQLIDAFSLFYLRFMNRNTKDEFFWTHTINTPQINNWAGYAFEQVCLMHLNQIKKALGILGMQTKIASWRNNDAQIDLVIERADRLINLCEIKFSSNQYEITKQYSEIIEAKRLAFLSETKTKYGIHQTMITTYGVSHTKYFGIINSEVVMNDLFV